MQRLTPWLLLALVAAARIHQQMAVMPPYAGLDEIYHVARLAFVREEDRQPSMTEPSVPAYLQASLNGAEDSLPVFGELRERWPDVVAARKDLLPAAPTIVKPYFAANYEAQHPSLYYWIAANLPRIGSPLRELQIWRGFSAVCAFLTVLVAGAIGYHVAGHWGLLAAGLLSVMPTWLTLTVRASNDALACLLLAAAVYATLREKVAAEAILWAAAFAVKLYTWPVAIVLPILWRVQRARPARWLTVVGMGTIAVVATVYELASRTNNPLGLFFFDPAPSEVTTALDYGLMLRIFIATFAWTSAQHFNALRPLAIAIYLLPVLVLLVVTWIRSRKENATWFWVCAAAVVAFAGAQVVNVLAYARTAVNGLPAGGKEGWYWYSLAPLGVGIALALALRYMPRAAAVALVVWMLSWDVMIQEGAQLQDFAGLTRATQGDAFIRWGPRRFVLPHQLRLERMSVGPGVGLIEADRVAQIAALMGLLGFAVREKRRRLDAATESAS